MRITYLGHAGLRVDGADLRLLMDPWLSTTGAFQAAWYQFPANAHLDQPGLLDCDYVTVSHEHLAAHALGQRAPERRDDEQDHRDAEPADGGLDRAAVDAWVAQAREEPQDELAEELEDVSARDRTALAHDIAQPCVGGRGVDRRRAETPHEHEPRFDTRDAGVEARIGRVQVRERRVVDRERATGRKRYGVGQAERGARGRHRGLTERRHVRRACADQRLAGCVEALLVLRERCGVGARDVVSDEREREREDERAR